MCDVREGDMHNCPLWRLKAEVKKEERLTCIHEHGDEKSNQMDSVFGINTFGSQDGQLENDRKEQFYAERLHLCSLHGAAAAL